MDTQKILEIIKNIGINKISEQNPSGIDPRYEDLYAILQDELNKLGSATAGGAISWKNLAETCIKVLQTLSKDIPAACYLPIALAYDDNENDKKSGFALWLAASQELLNLLQNFWETAFPAKKRIKGRVNALQWWLDRSKILLESEPFLATEIPENLFNQAIIFIDNLDKFFVDNLADNDIPLYELKEFVKRIPVKVEPPKVEEVSKTEEKIVEKTEAKIESTENNEKPAEQNTEKAEKSENIKNVENKNQEIKQEVSKEIPKAENIENTQKVITETPTQTINLDVKDLPDLSANVDTKTIQNALRQIAGSIINLFNDQNNEVLSNDIFLWKILYCALWGNLKNLPPCSDNKKNTFLPEPDSYFMQRLTSMVENKKYSIAIKSILENLYVSPFLFDLHQNLILCLKQLGEQYSLVVATIEFEFYNLLNRLKNIEELCFENGIPFANNKTKNWISQIKKSFQKGDSANNNEDAIIFEKLNSQCDKLVTENKFADALMLIDNQSLQYKITKPTLFLSLKLKQLELLFENDDNFLDLALLLSQNLEQFCINQKIQYWQPNLWIKFWKIVYSITQKMLVSDVKNNENNDENNGEENNKKTNKDDNNKNKENYLIAKEFNQKAITNLINSSVAEAVKIKN